MGYKFNFSNAKALPVPSIIDLLAAEEKKRAEHKRDSERLTFVLDHFFGGKFKLDRATIDVLMQTDFAVTCKRIRTQNPPLRKEGSGEIDTVSAGAQK